jgi:hypothetical protein
LGGGLKMKKLAIVGTSYYRNYAPFNDKNYEIWGVANCLFCNDIKRLDKIFEIHRKDEYIQDTYSKIYKTDLPVYMQKKDKKVKDCRIFPFKEIFKKYGDYFTNSLSLMLVFAVEQGFKDIMIYGVDFETAREKAIERPNFEYWVGYFRAKGIKIESYHKNRILKASYIYGIDNILKYRNPFIFRIKKLDEKMNEYAIAFHNKELSKEKKNEYLLKYFQYGGAKEALENEVSFI